MFSSFLWGGAEIWYCKILQRDISAGYCSGILQRDIAAGYFSGILQRDIAAGYCSGIFQRDIAAGYFSGILQRDISAGYCSGILQRARDESEKRRWGRRIEKGEDGVGRIGGEKILGRGIDKVWGKDGDRKSISRKREWRGMWRAEVKKRTENGEKRWDDRWEMRCRGVC